MNTDQSASIYAPRRSPTMCSMALRVYRHIKQLPNAYYRSDADIDRKSLTRTRDVLLCEDPHRCDVATFHKSWPLRNTVNTPTYLWIYNIAKAFRFFAARPTSTENHPKIQKLTIEHSAPSYIKTSCHLIPDLQSLQRNAPTIDTSHFTSNRHIPFHQQ